MDGGNEQSCHEILFQSRSPATETLVLVQNAYGNEALNRSKAFSWYFRFLDRKELIEDDERGGRLKSTRTEVNVGPVAHSVKKIVESHQEW